MEVTMPGMAAIAMGAAPVLGGALLGAAVGQLRGPDLREGIKQDLELLEQLPETEASRREALRRRLTTASMNWSRRTIRHASCAPPPVPMKETGVTSSYFSARCSSRLSGGLSTTTGAAGCPYSLPRLWRRSWRPATHSGECDQACSGCVVAPIVVSSRKRRPPGRARMVVQVDIERSLVDPKGLVRCALGGPYRRARQG